MLEALSAVRFRNLASFEQSFAPGTHLVLGDNGAGKTSLLEAIYCLATTRSFRTSRIADCCQHETSDFQIIGEVDTDKRIRLVQEWDQGKRRRTLNGSPAELRDYLSVLSAVCWTATDSDLLVGPPLCRRRFLDRGVLGLKPTAIELLSRYRRALNEKRKLLQQGGDQLEVWNQVLAESASKLVVLRSLYVERLRAKLGSILKETNLGLGKIEIAYRSSLRSGLRGAEAIHQELMDASRRERAFQQALLGPHRDDLKILWDGHELRRVASAGERKALGLVLIAAHGRVITDAGRYPIYLLDDADTELDSERLAVLWETFQEAQQVFATSNRPDVWKSLEIDRRWHCENGSLLLS